MTDLEIKYIATFGEIPPTLSLIENDSDVYQKILSEAIEKGEPIKDEDVDSALGGKYDLDSKDGSEFKDAFAKIAAK